MGITVRRARMDDYEGICSLLDEIDDFHTRALPRVFRHAENARSREFVKSVLENDDAIVIVAELAGRLIGIIQAIVQETPDFPVFVPHRYAHVGDIIVTEKYRQSGAGRLLMEEVEKWAHEKGLTSVELDVFDFNKGASAFYEKLGYYAASHTMKKELE